MDGPRAGQRSATVRLASSTSTRATRGSSKASTIPINFGMNACAGLAPEEMKGWARFEDIRRGGYDPAARLEEMDADGVDAEVLYPTPRLSQASSPTPTSSYHVAHGPRLQRLALGVRRGTRPSASAGLAMLPNCGVEHAVAELDRVLEPSRHAGRDDRVLPERHARARTRGRQGLGRGSPSAACR